jgi:hypothetical protein
MPIWDVLFAVVAGGVARGRIQRRRHGGVTGEGGVKRERSCPRRPLSMIRGCAPGFKDHASWGYASHARARCAQDMAVARRLINARPASHKRRVVCSRSQEHAFISLLRAAPRVAAYRNVSDLLMMAKGLSCNSARPFSLHSLLLPFLVPPPTARIHSPRLLNSMMFDPAQRCLCQVRPEAPEPIPAATSQTSQCTCALLAKSCLMRARVCACMQIAFEPKRVGRNRAGLVIIVQNFSNHLKKTTAVA